MRPLLGLAERKGDAGASVDWVLRLHDGTFNRTTPANGVGEGTQSLENKEARQSLRPSHEELSLVPTPFGKVPHRPVRHAEVVNALVETLGLRKIGVAANIQNQPCAKVFSSFRQLPGTGEVQRGGDGTVLHHCKKPWYKQQLVAVPS
jgi:hypothetical protein